MIWDQATDFMVLILLAAAAVSGGFQDYKAAIVLVIVVVFNVCIGMFLERDGSAFIFSGITE